jgi:ankyrin repeat protein
LGKQLGVDVNLSQSVDGATPLHMSSELGHEAVVRCLLGKLGANVNQARHDGCTPLFLAAQEGHEAVVVCLVKEFGADVDQASATGVTPLYVAANEGHEPVVRCLVKDFGANVNQARHNGITPLVAHSNHKKAKIIITLLTKYGADPQASHYQEGIAADLSKNFGAPAELTAYLEAKAHCSNPGCGGAGFKKCTGCKLVRYCCVKCQLAHWPLHKVECKVAKKRATKNK